MGIDLALILGHSLEAAELGGFPQRVRSSINMRRSAEQLFEVMRPRWSNLCPIEAFTTFASKEDVSEDDVKNAWERGETPSFEWAGFSLYFGKRALLASHLEKFAGFVLDLDGLRRPLQMCAQALAFELPSSTIVYGPDSASPFQEALCVVQGGSLSEILSVVKVKCGVPANSIREMADEDEELRLERRCYYIETVDLEGA